MKTDKNLILLGFIIALWFFVTRNLNKKKDSTLISGHEGETDKASGGGGSTSGGGAGRRTLTTYGRSYTG